MSSISRHEVVAVAAVKRFRELILGYKGPPERLKDFLLRQLDEWQRKGDSLLADIIDDIL